MFQGYRSVIHQSHTWCSLQHIPSPMSITTFPHPLPPLPSSSFFYVLNFLWFFSAWLVKFIYENHLCSYSLIVFQMCSPSGECGKGLRKRRGIRDVSILKALVHIGLWSLNINTSKQSNVDCVFMVIMFSSGFFSHDSLIHWYVWNEIFSYDFINIFLYFRCGFPDLDWYSCE